MIIINGIKTKCPGVKLWFMFTDMDLGRRLTASGSLVIISMTILKSLMLRWQVFKCLRTDEVVSSNCFEPEMQTQHWPFLRHWTDQHITLTTKNYISKWSYYHVDSGYITHLSCLLQEKKIWYFFVKID